MDIENIEKIMIDIFGEDTVDIKKYYDPSKLSDKEKKEVKDLANSILKVMSNIFGVDKSKLEVTDEDIEKQINELAEHTNKVNNDQADADTHVKENDCECDECKCDECKCADFEHSDNANTYVADFTYKKDKDDKPNATLIIDSKKNKIKLDDSRTLKEKLIKEYNTNYKVNFKKEIIETVKNKLNGKIGEDYTFMTDSSKITVSVILDNMTNFINNPDFVYIVSDIRETLIEEEKFNDCYINGSSPFLYFYIVL